MAQRARDRGNRMNKSKRAKGTQFQAWVEKWILKEFPDAAVHNFKSVAKKITRVDPKTGKKKEFWVSTDQDLFNCIDLEVKLPHCGKPIYIQATSHTGVDKRVKEMEHVPWSFDHQIIQLWQKKEPGRIVIQQLRDHPARRPSLTPWCMTAGPPKYEFYKIGEIKRGKYCPIIGKTLCEGGETGPQVL